MEQPTDLTEESIHRAFDDLGDTGQQTRLVCRSKEEVEASIKKALAGDKMLLYSDIEPRRYVVTNEKDMKRTGIEGVTNKEEE